LWTIIPRPCHRRRSSFQALCCVDNQRHGHSKCADGCAKPETIDSVWQSRDWRKVMPLQKFIIERDIPKVGTFERDQLRGAAAKSNEVLRQLGTDIQWVESYVADNKTFCVYLAKDEAIIHKHAEISGFPATKITSVKKMIDPTSAASGNLQPRVVSVGCIHSKRFARQG